MLHYTDVFCAVAAVPFLSWLDKVKLHLQSDPVNVKCSILLIGTLASSRTAVNANVHGSMPESNDHGPTVRADTVHIRAEAG